MRKILFLTVGGRHAPLLQSIKDHDADRVVFFASGVDEATKNKATASMHHVTGIGSVIRSKPNGPLDLPSIPVQANLLAEQWASAEVVADDLDETYHRIHKTMAGLRTAYPNARLIADYTGGTKTMTAALCLAALQCGAELSVVTGPRSDLFGVTSGQGTRSVTDEQIRFDYLRHRISAAWQRYAFDEVLQLLKDFGSPSISALRVEVEQLRAQARMFDAWDRFNFEAAISAVHAFEVFRRDDQVRERIQVLETLAQASSQTPIAPPNASTAITAQQKKRLWNGRLQLLNDLWLNAQRRGSAHRYDDAAARWYRLTEWTAQTWLTIEHQLDTGNLDHSRVPGKLLPSPNREGQYQIGLIQAWELLATLSPNQPAGLFYDQHSEALRHLVLIRNHSLLAHGVTPVGEAEWRRLATFTQTALFPLLQQQAKAVGAKLPEQWPQAPAGPFLAGDKLVAIAATDAH